MLRGHCLCEGVRFEVAEAVGPFELCHCPRCRRVSGGTCLAGLGVRVSDFELLSGADLIRTYDAPILECPPAYRVAFCSRCGSHPNRAGAAGRRGGVGEHRRQPGVPRRLADPRDREVLRDGSRRLTLALGVELRARGLAECRRRRR